MRIPKDSTFSKELSKKFNRIFHKDITLFEIMNLQEDLINPVDTYLENQVRKIRKHNETIVQDSGTIRQDYSKGEIVREKITESKNEEETVGCKTS